MVGLGCWGCMATEATNLVNIVQSAIVIIILIIAYRINLKKPDPFGIINEIRLIVWIGGVPAVLSLILSVVTDRRNNFKFDILIEIFLTIVCFIQSVLQCILALYDRRKEKEAMLQFDMTLHEFEDKVIKEKSPYHLAFSTHLAAEHGFESLAFVKGILQWEREYFDSNPKTNKVRARKLLNMYVGQDAVLPCNLPESIVKRMHSHIGSEEDLPREFFKMAKEEMIALLYRDSFKRFIKTKAFRALREQLQETENTV